VKTGRAKHKRKLKGARLEEGVRPGLLGEGRNRKKRKIFTWTIRRREKIGAVGIIGDNDELAKGRKEIENKEGLGQRDHLLNYRTQD